uniref:Uncharacterized protein n=1 Tax=Rhizophora mucronata TaxID=61149 RepID=A0A2P2R277_RHIMU
MSRKGMIKLVAWMMLISMIVAMFWKLALNLESQGLCMSAHTMLSLGDRRLSIAMRYYVTFL